MDIFQPTFYYSVVGGMICLAVIVFIILQRITPGYGMMYSGKWGPSVGNRLGWVLMEAPVFIAMLLLWLCSPHRGDPALVVIALLFEAHYFRRAFIFPLLMRGKNRMPLVIILSGVIFNVINAYMIGGWLFYISPESYPVSWLWNPLFLLGLAVFLAGITINIQSDRIIRHLRKPGDTRHYIPRGGMFRYVSCANYFGEFTEWLGFALLTMSPGAFAFAVWTFANLAPRAKAVHRRYCKEFGDDYRKLRRRYIIPFIY